MPWKKIKDSNVEHFWICPTCKDKLSVNPTFYQDNGTPMCTDCDEDMEFLHTKIGKANIGLTFEFLLMN